MTELIGQSLGQYQVTAQIGKGGMATVYQAVQTSMKRIVAIKVLPQSLTHEEKFLERFYREVQIVAALQHPHILPVYDFGEFQGTPYIVMAYMNGGTMADLIQRGPVEAGEARRMVQQMADALDYAHRKGVIHRDFKPGNVLLDDQNNTYLTDFGLARMTEHSGQLTGTGILGTPSYMAPEQAEPGDLTPAADVYALGVTVYQMLTGKVPYEAPTPLGVLMAHITQPIPDIRRVRPDLPLKLQAVFDRAMAKTADARYPTAGALAQAFHYALDDGAEAASSAPAEAVNALLMTNVVGQVIFLDQICLKLLKRHHHEARTIIGKPLSEVLGIDKADVDQMIQHIGKAGALDRQRLDIHDSYGGTLSVWLSAVVTRDDKGGFVGADFTLQPAQDIVLPPEGFESVERPLDTTEESLLQRYFVRQMEGLRKTVVQIGGGRLGNNLDRIINETAERNVWPVSMQGGTITVELKNSETDVYRALLSKAIAYAVTLVGKPMVKKGMQAVDAGIEPRVLALVSELKVYDLFDVL